MINQNLPFHQEKRNLVMWLIALIFLIPEFPMAQNRYIQIIESYRIIPNGLTSKVELSIPIPADIKHCQKMYNISYSQRPIRTFHELGTKYLLFEWNPLLHDSEIQIKYDLEIMDFDYSVGKVTGNKAFLKKGEIKRYTNTKGLYHLADFEIPAKIAQAKVSGR